MRVLLQRVSEADVTVSGRQIAKIGRGLLIFLGVNHADTEKEIDFLFEKIVNLRIFEDDALKMNFSLKDIGGEVLIVSQFTLYADCNAGRRPSFTEAARPESARELYNKFVQKFKEAGVPTQHGEFAAMMAVRLVNDGPVTIWLETGEKGKS